MAAPRIEFFLARLADTAWNGAIRPWLEEGHGRLERGYVVVATRGQAQGLKQRCVADGVALLGVEFLTPGLARKKWLPLSGSEPAIGRELLLFELRLALAGRLRALAPDDPGRGLWMSLQSDAERALDDFDELLKAGFGPDDFPQPALREIFGELATRVETLGFVLGARQSEMAALAPVPADAPRIGGRVLVHGLTAESWGEFFNVAAFVRRFDRVTVVLPEAEFRGQRALDEAWIEVWQAFLGVSALPLEEAEASPTCEYIAAGWAGAPAAAPTADECPRILVGQTRTDEVQRVADEVARLLDEGAEDIAVVFPRADAAHARLVGLLAERGIAFLNLLEAVGATSLEAQLQRALLTFHERGGLLEDLLELWPLLRAAGLANVPLAAARDVCERLFDSRQTHALDAYLETLASSKRPEWREVGRVAQLLLPLWPDEMALADALSRFEVLCERLLLALPPGWATLTAFAQRETRVLPAGEILSALAMFLPDRSPVANAPGRSGFARVILTTRRRAEGLAWSHTIFVESNAGVWPGQSDRGGWLSDEHRLALNQTGRFSLGVFTAEDRRWLEKRSYAALARDTRQQVVFSAALFDDAEPENQLAPNSWLERVLWRQLEAAGAPTRDLGAVFENQARATKGSAPAQVIDEWLGVWRGRRDPARAFDEYFLSVDPAHVRPAQLPARLIERAVCDPAELWFGAVIDAAQVDWRSFMRARKRSLGQLAHRVIAAALQGAERMRGIVEKPALADVQPRLADGLKRLRHLWPADRYWDSFHAELTQVCTVLVENLYALQTGSYLATEFPLPQGATVPLGTSGERLNVIGRVDVVFLDRPELGGAEVDVVDFKTGADPLLSAQRMARDGSALQLGVYLAAAQSLGARAGRVWMIKPEPGVSAAMDMSELASALTPLEQIGRHLATGRYGALTAERSAYAPEGFSWPIACVPIAEAVLREKFKVTFGNSTEEAE